MTALVDTIYALSSAAGKAGVSVVRVSGPKAHESLKALILDKRYPGARDAAFLSLTHPDTGEVIDQALVLRFDGPYSFTGENVVEYHLHGSTAVMQSLFGYLSSCNGHRMAQPGEYTRRAFENGKLDLTEAEAVADLIAAETQAQKMQALSQMEGNLSALYHGWAARLAKSLAYIEAVIDFPDEDVPDDQIAEAYPAIEKLIDEIADHLDDNRRGERLRDGIRIAVIGAPNAGKSSLVNLLAQRDVAIVSDIAGTTRDVIDVHLNIAGFPVILSDTAGLRPDQLSDSGYDKIESEGIRRAIKKAETADMRLLVFDGASDQIDIHTQNLINNDSIIVINKCDLFEDNSPLADDVKGIQISTQTSENVDELLKILEQKIISIIGVSRETPSLTRERHRESLNLALRSLQHSLEAQLPELTAEGLRMAIRGLGRITGRVDVEDLLDIIFKDFCIGK